LIASISARPSNAASAAICARVGTEMARFCCRRSIGRTSVGGTIIQPMRQPVMQKYFENELMITTLGESFAAVSAGNA
jgi:hypothetical protein